MYLEQTHVVVAGVVVAAYTKAGEVEQVDAPAVSFRGVHGQVDAGKLLYPFVKHVNEIIFVFVVRLGALLENGSQFLKGVDVFLRIGVGEAEAELSGTVEYGQAGRNELRAVGNVLRAAGVGAHGQGALQFRYADVLHNAGLVVVVARHGVGLEAQREADGSGVGTKVDGVQHRNQRESRLAGGEAQDIVPDGADGKLGRRIARQGVGVLHLNLCELELDGMGVVQKGFVNKPFAQAVVNLYAARNYQGCRQAQGQEFSHFSKLS